MAMIGRTNLQLMVEMINQILTLLRMQLIAPPKVWIRIDFKVYSMAVAIVIAIHRQIVMSPKFTAKAKVAGRS